MVRLTITTKYVRINLMARKGQENLKPFNKITKEAQREIAKKGAAVSNKKQAEKRLLKDTLLMLLSNKPTPDMVNECAEKFGFNPKDLQEVITGGLMAKAMTGDAKAFEVIRDSIGQKPKEEVVNTNLNTDATIEELKSYFEQ